MTITKREYNQFYVFNYFNEPKRIIRFMRMYMGPTLVLISMYLFYAYKEKINVLIIGFLFAYGLFYTVKPLILLLAVRAKDETFTYEFRDHSIYIKDRLNEGTIDLTKNHLIENKRYFLVKMDNNQVMFFPKDKLSEKLQNQFRKHIN